MIIIQKMILNQLDEINQNENNINNNTSNLSDPQKKEHEKEQFLRAFDEINYALIDREDINKEKDELNINILKDNNIKQDKKKIIYPKNKKSN